MLSKKKTHPLEMTRFPPPRLDVGLSSLLFIRGGGADKETEIVNPCKTC